MEGGIPVQLWLIGLIGSCSVLCVSSQRSDDEGGMVEDSLNFGLLDNLYWEVGTSFLFIIPFLIFLFGVVAIPASLVITYLVLLPLIVPPESEAARRRKKRSQRETNINNDSSMINTAMNVLSRSDCLNQVICRIGERQEQTVRER
jgi:hypothetical protein